MKYSVSQKIFEIVYNGSNYEYNLVLNKLVEELFEGQVICSGENTEK